MDFSEFSKRWADSITPSKELIRISNLRFTYSPLKLFLTAEIVYGEEKETKLKELLKRRLDLQIAPDDTEEIIQKRQFEERYLKRYLIENAHKYGIEFLRDLDVYSYTKRGDVEGLRNKKRINIEVEKKDTDFIHHGHKVSESESDADDSSIDLVFTLPPQNVNLGVETIYADINDFSKWFKAKICRETTSDECLLILTEIIRRRLLGYSLIELIQDELNDGKEISNERKRLYDEMTLCGGYLVSKEWMGEIKSKTINESIRCSLDKIRGMLRGKQ